jgi:hypothetical protein
MPLPTFDALDQIPEPFRAEYEERDGKWHPKGADTSGLTSALASERERAEQAEKARKAAERRAAELERAQKAAGAGITDEQLAQLRAEDEQRRKAELEPVQTEVSTLKEKLRRYELEEPVRKLLSVGTPGGLFMDEWDDPAIRDSLLRRFGTTDGGALVVLDEQGKPSSERPEAFVAAYRAKYPRRFEGDAGSGSGATRPSGGGGVTAPDVVARKRQTGHYATL